MKCQKMTRLLEWQISIKLTTITTAPKINDRIKIHQRQRVQTKYCYSFNETGSCRFGSSCLYEHRKNPNHVTREPREHSNQNKNNKGEWQSESTPITKNYRTTTSDGVGPPRGKSNYKGKHYKSQMNSIQTVDENASLKSLIVSKNTELSTTVSSLQPFSSWENTTAKPFEYVNGDSDDSRQVSIQRKLQSTSTKTLECQK